MTADPRERLAHASSILGGDLGLCGCGNAEESYVLVRQLLQLTPFYEHWDQVAALLPHTAARHIVLSAMESAGLIEHGTSISGSWITPKGQFFLDVLQEIGDDWDCLRELGLPHYGGDCTDACWTRKSGHKG